MTSRDGRIQSTGSVAVATWALEMSAKVTGRSLRSWNGRADSLLADGSWMGGGLPDLGADGEGEDAAAASFAPAEK